LLYPIISNRPGLGGDIMEIVAKRTRTDFVTLLFSNITGYLVQILKTYSRQKPEGKRPVGRLKLKWEDNIKMDLHEMVCGRMDWIELAWD
jgi:hypothetical protein